MLYACARMARHIELVWRCSSCGTRNLGRHAICSQCGSPKDESEEYEMPTDSREVASVVDPDLLDLARGGPNWRCGYCDSHQRAGNVHCLRCGAARSGEWTGAPPFQSSHEPPPYVPVQAERKAALGPYTFWLVILLLLFCTGAASCAACSSCVSSFDKPVPPRVEVEAPLPRTDFVARVVGTHWSRRVRAERWQLVTYTDFRDDVPADAINVRAAGMRVHHTDQVVDGETTIYEDEEVPDGYRTESYREREECGETCTTTPRRCRDVCTTSSKRCREVCTSSRNGFASCRDVCTGGDRSCHEECTGGDRDCAPKYCERTRTRQIPKTRTVKVPRRVPRYRDVPRYAAWASYQTWEWVEVETATAAGDDAVPRWPSLRKSIPAARRLVDGATPKAGSMREVRDETLELTLETDDGARHVYAAESEAELQRLASPDRKLDVRVSNGTVQLRP